MNNSFTSIENALKAIKKGEFVVVLDNEDRENEGDLIMAAEFATEASLAFMIRYSSGVVCVPALQKRLKKLELPLMVANNSEVRQCKFTISVDLIKGNTTGISAADRARTITAIADDEMTASDFSRPGHIFPLLALDGGVIARAGHTEAAIDLARLAGCKPIGYICEINNDEGKMMRRLELESFAKLHNLHLITMTDLVQYRFAREELVMVDEEAPAITVHSPHGSFQHYTFKSLVDSSTYDVLLHGIVNEQENILVHIVRSGVKGTVNAQWAQQKIQLDGRGAVIYPSNNLNLEQISGKDMANRIIFGMCMQIMRKLGATSVRLLSSTRTYFDVNSFGIQVNEVINFV